jgi:endonuclease/exonuclease/phosphatase family metal-dependent hydrolase
MTVDQLRDAPASQPLGVGSSEGLGPAAPERAAFARWCRENGHGELDDMLTPLDRSLRALMWPVWQGAVAAERERLRAILREAVAVRDGPDWPLPGSDENMAKRKALWARIEDELRA